MLEQRGRLTNDARGGVGIIAVILGVNDVADAAVRFIVFRQTACFAASSTALAAPDRAAGSETVRIGSLDAVHTVAACCTPRLGTAVMVRCRANA